ncbi:soluble scavenger receptor cysteine-rich domain-containing protein SSC5D-like [Branchiostoma floridae]|uniref:Soluble scavenger receptor cysteine-rich domain-containing protein SSC5D n=1 Tax=Branchiostoma floridae TaxID=7739 RepID=A0A9J7KKQ6_BRAFL|nr:soluble scavenger receptor cysteine-rich domain-containing protein SSC5D-like [Branchiostoma floridae]
MASAVLLAVLVLCVSFPARAQDVRPHQEYVDKGYCTYTYVVPPGSRTGSFSPPRLEEQLAETKEETGRLKNEVDLLVQTLLGLQSVLTSRLDNLSAELSEEKVRSAQLEQNLTRELQEQETRLQTQVQNLTQELQEQETRLQTQVQNLTQALQEQETRLQTQVQNLAQELQEQETRLQTQVQNLTTTFYEHDVIIKQQLQLVPEDVSTTLPSDAVPTAVTPITRITSPTKLQPTTRNTKSPAAENITTTQPGTPHPATEPTGSVIGMQLQVRLVGGSTLLEGRVEVRNGTGQWGSVCDDNFDLQDAHVVCRQLGFGAALEVKLAGHFGEGSGNVWLDEVSCRGNETDLGDCPADSWGRSDCSHKEDAGVVCAGDAALRLVGGPVPWKGRLQIRPWGALEWGAVCNTSWTEAEAGFVCRQMGYTGGVTSSGQADIGEGSENIWLGDVTCSGDETNILSCGFSWEPSYCDHSQDVQIICTGGVSVRFTGSQSPLQGRVEVRTRHGDWGTVCDDGFDDRDAQVVCRQLGYRGGVATAGGDFGEGTGNIWLRNLNCFGNESSLEGCPIQNSNSRDCVHGQDVGVVCRGDASVRLTGGQDSLEGRVEVQPENGDWGTVCDDGFDDRDAQVVCRQLGYYTGSARVGGVFPEGTGNIWLDNLNCAGNESSVADCEINRWGDHDCTHKEDAGVVCVPEEDCAEYYSSGVRTSGVYRIGLLPADVEAYCDMETVGGGWTVIQRRQDGSVPFNRTWEEYKLGFGNKNGEYWLGNENIHLLTNQKNYRLRIDLLDWQGESRYAEYSTFRVSGESDGYRLHISGYSGTAGDSMTGNHANNGQRFSTVDRDNDDWSRHCSQERGQAGWWFLACSYSFLNGRYLGNCGSSCPYAQGVVWYHWRGFTYSLKSVSMKIRP